MAQMLQKTTTTTVRGRSNTVVRHFEFTRKTYCGEERLYIHRDMYVPVHMLNIDQVETADSPFTDKRVVHKWELHTPVSKNLDLGTSK